MKRNELKKVLRSGQILYTYCNFCGKELDGAKYFCCECLEILGDLIEDEKYKRLLKREDC
jgi:uncharacterized OB-fold protein